MARKARLILDDACYHVMARGNQKQKTFVEKSDFMKYLELLRHYKREFKFRLYGYCLMPNHIHLILQINDGAQLGKIMQGLNQTYTILFNAKYAKVGHLWQGRYKSMVIQNNKYLLECIEYVELNPIRAELCKSPFHYPWSSWQERLGYKKKLLLDLPELI